MNQAKIRYQRSLFEHWANSEGMSSGRDEGGYYDDDTQAAAAWRVWRACARVNAMLQPRRSWWRFWV